MLHILMDDICRLLGQHQINFISILELTLYFTTKGKALLFMTLR